MSEQDQHLQAIQDIRHMMQRSSRFLSLSGLSGIAAGIWALAGAFIAHNWIHAYYKIYNDNGGFTGSEFQWLKFRLFFLAAAVLGLALLSAFYFTWRRTRATRSQLWNH